MNPGKKPPVRVFNIVANKRDVITDTDYAVAVELQAAVLRAQKAQYDCLDRIRKRLERGAEDAGEHYYFDPQLRIVRRRGKEEKEA